MKELSIEEKAKRYDEAIERARTEYKNHEAFKGFCEMLVNIFPELKESRNEKIRNWLLDFVQGLPDECLDFHFYNLTKEEVLTWLEKQGQHKKFRDSIQVGDEVTRNRDGMLVNLSRLKRVAKPVDKVEPKFKYGDWIIFNGLTLYINEVVEGYYRTISKGGIINSYDWGIDNAARLWTLNEATEGDVLLSPSTLKGDKECIFIFKEIDKNGVVRYNVALQGEHLEISNGVTNVSGYAKAGYHIPATKEQRDKLEKAMLKAGYRWNTEECKPEKI